MEKNLVILGLVLNILLVLRLWRTGLHSPFRHLFLYSFFVLIRSGVPVLAGWKQNSGSYAYWWAFSEPIFWLLAVLLALDLCASIFHQFPALTSWGGRIYKAALGVGVVLSLGTLFLSGAPEQFIWLHILLAVQRVVLTSLLLVILALLFSLAWFRVNLTRNTLNHAVIFFVYFLAKAGVVFLLQTVGLQIRGNVNMALTILADACFLAWIVGLTPRGQNVELRVGHQWNPEEGERLVRQLALLNDSLASRQTPTTGVRGIANEQ